MQTQKSFISKLYVQKKTFLPSEDVNVIANELHLGYTFVQYLDSSGSTLATLNIYTVPQEQQTHYDQLLRKVLRKIEKKDLLVVPLFDYRDDPNQWLRTLNTWLSLTDDTIQVQELNCLIVTLNRGTVVDWDQDIHEYIQLSLRSVALIHGFSVIYTTGEFQQMLENVATLLKLPFKESFIPLLKPYMVDYQEFFIPRGSDSWTKINALSEEINAESEAKYWKLDDPENDYITKYESIVPSVQKKVVKKKKKKEPTKERVPPMKYQQFLDAMWEKQRLRKARAQTGT